MIQIGRAHQSRLRGPFTQASFAKVSFVQIRFAKARPMQIRPMQISARAGPVRAANGLQLKYSDNCKQGMAEAEHEKAERDRGNDRIKTVHERDVTH